MTAPENTPSTLRALLPKIALFAAAGLLLLFVTAGLRSADHTGWIDDQDQALAKAREEKKLVLLDFTGSDWCESCLRLEKEVFSTPEFKKYAEKHLVLMEVDFPRRKYIPPQIMQQNEALSKKYGVEGYPTIVVLDAEGKTLGQFVYGDGGPKVFSDTREALPKA